MPATAACEGVSEQRLQPKVNAAMKLASLLALALAAGAIACTELASTTAPQTAESPPDPAAASQVGPAHVLPGTLPPPSAAHPRFVGLWATTVEGCSAPAWRFDADHVSTQGEVSCSFRSVRQTPAGYDIDASCTAEAPPRDYRIQIGFAESARAMMLSGGPWDSGAGLVYCGPLPNP